MDVFHSISLTRMNFTGPIEANGRTNMKPVHTRRAIIWGQGDLLSRTIGFLLGANTVWDVSEVSCAGRVEDLFRDIERVNPEVVILCHGKVDDNPDLPPKLARNHPDLRVVSVGAENNNVQVYNQYNVVLQSASDFFLL